MGLWRPHCGWSPTFSPLSPGGVPGCSGGLILPLCYSKQISLWYLVLPLFSAQLSFLSCSCSPTKATGHVPQALEANLFRFPGFQRMTRARPPVMGRASPILSHLTLPTVLIIWRLGVVLWRQYRVVAERAGSGGSNFGSHPTPPVY